MADITLTLTPDEQQQLADAVQAMLEDKEQYHKSYGFGDYDADDLKTMAEGYETLAGVMQRMGMGHLAEQLTEFMETIDAEIAEMNPVIAELVADPDFVAILAKNVKHFLEHGHDTDPLPSK